MKKIPSEFDWKYYTINNIDLLNAGINNEELAKHHYLNNGYHEYRKICENDNQFYFNFDNFCKELSCSHLIDKNDFIFHFVNNHLSHTNESAINYYFLNGLDSTIKLKNILDEYKINNGTLLEFASGYGCLTRHMANIIPFMDVTCSDIHDNAIFFIKNILKYKTIKSKTIPEELIIDKFRVIFVLSFFSHMPIKTWERWLQKLFSLVQNGGILIFTCHSKTSAKNSGIKMPDSGFFFTNNSEQKDLSSEEYGMTITLPHFVFKYIDQLENVEHVKFLPSYWWEHQDLYIISKK